MSAALADPQWKQAMKNEFQALLKNNTWDLVPYSDALNVVQNKWVFHCKYKVDGALDRIVQSCGIGH